MRTGSTWANAPPAALASSFTIPVGRRWLLYAPLAGTAALVNAAAVGELANWGGGPAGATGAIGGACALLAAEGLSSPQPRTGPIDPVFLGLIPTRACNLGCAYCGFGARQAAGQSMPHDTAATAIDWMAEVAAATGRSTLDVHLFGGEPLFDEEAVDVIVHQTRAKAAELGLAPRLEVSTNGVCSRQRAVFVGDHFQAIVLSLDGNAAIHDRTRAFRNGKGSFEHAARAAHIWKEAPAELCIRVCVTAESVDQLESTIAWLIGEFQPAVIDVETLQSNEESRQAGLREPDPYEFAKRFSRAARKAAGEGCKLTYAAAVRELPRASFCPVGNDAVIVSPDGRVSACYLQQEDWQRRGLDLDFGRIGSGTVAFDRGALARIRRMASVKPRCRACFCQWSCAGGCHVNHSYPGNPAGYDDFCIQTRLITAISLLEELGARDDVERLLGSRQEMETLAMRPSDLLIQQQEPRARAPELRPASRGPHRPAPGITWSVEQRGALVFDRSRTAPTWIGYPEAAIWDLLTRGTPWTQLVAVFATVAGVTADDAEKQAGAACRAWVESGLLEREAGGG